jgi:hypothetical protein
MLFIDTKRYKVGSLHILEAYRPFKAVRHTLLEKITDILKIR